MPDPFFVLFGGFLVSAAVALWIALNRGDRIGSEPGRNDEQPPPPKNAATSVRRRGQLAGCIALGTIGLDVAVVYGAGIPSSGGTGITVELGFAMMLLAVVWFIFRREAVLYQVRIATAMYGLRTPAEPRLIKAAEATGAFIRLLLFLPGLFIVLLKLILR
ncbi:hypothetical protein V3C33_02145 [Micrococcaceae bacterium Sec5.7]